MIDKELFGLIGGNKKYIFIAVALQVLGLIANVTITASVCYAVYCWSTERKPYGLFIRLSALSSVSP